MQKYKGILPKWADALSQALVLYSIVTFTVESEPRFQDHPFFYISELVVTSLFIIEYIARERHPLPDLSLIHI
mgnify:CR=1 FL=1